MGKLEIVKKVFRCSHFHFGVTGFDVLSMSFELAGLVAVKSWFAFGLPAEGDLKIVP